MLRGRPLALLLAVAALLSVAWTFTTAPLQGPDEPAHFNYAQHLAETGGKPMVAGGDHPDSTQVFAALYFLGLDQLAGVPDARPAWSPIEEGRFEATLRDAGEAAEEDGAGPNALAKNPPLYYAYQALPYYAGSVGSFWDRLIVMRLASGLLFLLTVAFAWLAAAELFARTWPRLLATGCVALLPQLTALSGTINSDNLLVTAWTGFTFAALRLVHRGPSARRIMVLCAFAAVSLLTHGRGLAIVAPLVVALVVALARARPSLGQALRALAPGLGLLALVFGAYRALLAPSTGAYGGEVVLPSSGLSVSGFLSFTWQFFFPRLPLMEPRPGPDYGYRQVFIESFFGKFATLEVSYPTIVYSLIAFACLLGIAGLVAAVAGRWPEVRARWPEVTVLGAVAVSMVGLLLLASYRALIGGSADPLITGRYLLPVVAVFSLTVAFVVSSLRPRASALVGAFVLSALLALNLSGLMLTLTRFYG